MTLATVCAGTAATVAADGPGRGRHEDAGAPPAWTEARVQAELRTLRGGSEEDRERALAALATAPAKAVCGPAGQALRRAEDPYERVMAAQVLGQVRDPHAIDALVEAALRDPVGKVRTLAVAGLSRLQGPEAAWPFIEALGSAEILRRIFAAEAVGALGNPHAIGVLIERILFIWGATNRGFAFFGQQITYIKDFDVEVAANAAIAKPILGVVSSGAVQDVKVLKVTREIELVERRVVADSLRRLTGADFGENGKAWAAWWGTNRQEVLGKYAATRTAEERAVRAGELFAAAYRAEAAGELGPAQRAYEQVTGQFADTRFAPFAAARLRALSARPDLVERVAAETEESAAKGLLGKARSFLASGDRVRAVAACRELLEKHAQSELVGEATRLLRSLEAAPEK